MKFEPLKFEHLQQMAEIEREAFDQPWTVNMFIPEVENDNAHYVVGVRGDEVICYGGFHKILDEAHITNIAVKKGERGRGIGKFLMSELLARAKMLGVKSVTLEVRSDNIPALNMYESFGFTVEGVRRKYYNNMYDALIMWLSF